MSVSLRPVSAFQSPRAGEKPTVDRTLIDQFVAADAAERRNLVSAHAELLSGPYRAEFSIIGNAMKAAEPEKAQSYYRAALFVAREYHFPDTEAASLNNLGILEGNWRNIPAAKRLLEEALSVATANNDAASVQSSYANLAIIQRLVGDLDGALVTQTHAMELAQKLGDRVAVSRTLNNIGVVYYNMGNLGRALQYYLDSLAIKESLDFDPTDTVRTLSNIVGVYDEQNDIPLALEYAQRALDVMKAHKAPESAGINILNNLGHLYLTYGDFTQARANLNRSLALAEQLGDPSKISTTLYNLATIARIEKKPEEAEALWRRSLDLREKTGEPLGLSETLTDLAHHLEGQGRATEALGYAQRAVTLAEQSRLINQLWKAQLALGDTQAHLGKNLEARQSYEASVATVERLRQQVAGGPRGVLKFLSDRMGPYYGLANIDVKLGHPFDALATIDKARARALVDIMHSGPRASRLLTPEQRAQEALVTQTVIDASLQLDQEARKTTPDPVLLAELDRAASKARITRDAFLSELYNSAPDFSFVRGNTPDITLEGIAASLTPDTALVTFAVSDSSATAYFVTLGARGPEIVTTPLKRCSPTPTPRKPRSARACRAPPSCTSPRTVCSMTQTRCTRTCNWRAAPAHRRQRIICRMDDSKPGSWPTSTSTPTSPCCRPAIPLAATAATVRASWACRGRCSRPARPPQS